MDGNTFDAWVRRLPRESSRHGLLRAGIAALAAALLGLVGLSAGEQAEARKKR